MKIKIHLAIDVSRAVPLRIFSPSIRREEGLFLLLRYETGGLGLRKLICGSGRFAFISVRINNGTEHELASLETYAQPAERICVPVLVDLFFFEFRSRKPM